MNDKANFVAVCSVWKAINVLFILFSWLIFPLLIMIIQVVYYRNNKYYFYDDKIVNKSGFFSKKETELSFVGVTSIHLEQSFFGRIFKFGDLRVYIAGRNEPIKLYGIKNPNELKKYLSTKIISTNNSHTIVNV